MVFISYFILCKYTRQMPNNRVHRGVFQLEHVFLQLEAVHYIHRYSATTPKTKHFSFVYRNKYDSMFFSLLQNNTHSQVTSDHIRTHGFIYSYWFHTHMDNKWNHQSGQEPYKRSTLPTRLFQPCSCYKCLSQISHKEPTG